MGLSEFRPNLVASLAMMLAGLGMLGSVIAVLGAVLVALFGIVVLPIRMILRRRRKAAEAKPG